MAWYSVLPAHLTVYETWIIRTFIFLAIINMAPWMSLIIYDLLLYVFRTIYHEIPVVGGRARGETRPRAPSLAEPRPKISLTGLMSSGSNSRGSDGTSTQSPQLRSRPTHIKRVSEHAISDEMEGI